jgi:hypothetical protein
MKKHALLAELVDQGPRPNPLFVVLADTVDAAPADPLRVLFMLNAKFDNLGEAALKLMQQEALTTDSAEELVLMTERQTAIAERAYCQARMDAIRAAGPFSDPGTNEERRLLAAIQAVGAAAVATGAANTLATAVRGLIAAYGAKATQPA